MPVDKNRQLRLKHASFLMLEGKSNTEIVNELVNTYGISERQAYRDIQDCRQVAQRTDLLRWSEKIPEILDTIDYIILEAIKAPESEECNAKIKALSLALNAVKVKAEVFVSLGILPENIRERLRQEIQEELKKSLYVVGKGYESSR